MHDALHVTWLIQMWHGALTCHTSRTISMWDDMSQSNHKLCTMHDSLHVTWLIQMWHDALHVIRHELNLCELYTQTIRHKATTNFVQCMTHYIWHDSFKCDMTHSMSRTEPMWVVHTNDTSQSNNELCTMRDACTRDMTHSNAKWHIHMWHVTNYIHVSRSHEQYATNQQRKPVWSGPQISVQQNTLILQS